MVRDLIGEVVGLSPYEKRLLDMLKTGGVSSEKRMYKFAKRRVSASPFCWVNIDTGFSNGLKIRSSES